MLFLNRATLNKVNDLELYIFIYVLFFMLMNNKDDVQLFTTFVC